MTLLDLAARLAQAGVPVERDVPLAPFTTYKVGGPARLLVRPVGRDGLLAVAGALRGEPVLVVGRGSNLLVADTGFDGLVILTGQIDDTIVTTPTDASTPGSAAGATVTAGAAVAMPVLARRTAALGLTGLEWMVGVPGSVGGAVRMNAGGHGSDVAASLVDADVLDLTNATLATRTAAGLGLRFRGSDLAATDVVVSARFTLAPGDRERSEEEIAEIVRWRREHQPGGQNAGSVFVNPVPGELAAAQLIDGLGLRGLRIGTAEVSTKHANFIQADEGASAADVRAVMEEVRARVHAATGVLLRSEVRLIGFDEDGPA